MIPLAWVPLPYPRGTHQQHGAGDNQLPILFWVDGPVFTPSATALYHDRLPRTRPLRGEKPS